MTIWRFTARFTTLLSTTSGFETPGEITRPYSFPLESEEEGLQGLNSFLSSRQREHGERLRWVALERSEFANNFDDTNAEWLVVKWQDV